jgi:DNA-binding transcriptional regulator YiaG
MSDTARGYSTLFVRKVDEANQKDLAIRFAQACIKREMPMISVASAMGVSRATVYNWFTGKFRPHKKHQELMQQLMVSWRS